MGTGGYILIIVNNKKRLYISNNADTDRPNLGVELIRDLITLLKSCTVEEIREAFDKLIVLNYDTEYPELRPVFEKWFSKGPITFQGVLGAGYCNEYQKPSTDDELDREVIFMEYNYVLDFENQTFASCCHDNGFREKTRDYVARLKRDGRLKTMLFDGCEINIDKLESIKSRWQDEQPMNSRRRRFLPDGGREEKPYSHDDDEDVRLKAIQRIEKLRIHHNRFIEILNAKKYGRSPVEDPVSHQVEKEILDKAEQKIAENRRLRIKQVMKYIRDIENDIEDAEEDIEDAKEEIAALNAILKSKNPKHSIKRPRM
jgi:hypothetical protein